MSAGAPGALSHRFSSLPSRSSAVAHGRAAVLGVPVVLASVLAGMAILDPRGSALVLPTVGLALLVGIAALNRGAFVGLVALGVMNGLPGIDLERFAVRGQLRATDLMLTVLIAALAFWTLTAREDLSRGSRWLPLIRVWSLAFGAWWLVTLGRSVLFDDIPLLKAALFGRDFLYFAILLPLLPAALRTGREMTGLVGSVGFGVVVFAVAQTAASLFPSVSAVFDPSLLINETLTNEFEGVTRVYAYMGDAVIAGTVIAAGGVILARSAWHRNLARVVFLVCAISSLTQLSRAAYASLLIGILVLLTLCLRGAPARRAVAKKILPGILLIVAIYPVLSLVHPTDRSSGSAAAIVAARAESGIEEFQTRTGTFGYRAGLTSRMLDVLGDDWPIGVGFWHPEVRPVAGLPEGSIRNGDVGVLNSVMTVGVVGTLLLYLPIFGTMIFLVRRRSPARPDGWDGLVYGSTGWLAGLVVASISLVTLFSVSGLVLTAVVLAAAFRLAVRTEPERVTTTETGLRS